MLKNIQYKKIIKETILKHLNENLVYNSDIKSILIKRIPFLKDYKIFKDDKRLEAQRVVYNKNIKMVMGDQILNFEQFNISSNIYYYPQKINDNEFHNFTIKNEFYPTKPKEIDDLTFRIFLIAIKNLEKQLSYSKEIIVKNGQEFPKNELDKIINEMNGILFKIEEFTEKHQINLF